MSYLQSALIGMYIITCRHVLCCYALDSGTLHKLFDKIKTQRDEWIKRSVQAVPEMEGEGLAQSYLTPMGAGRNQTAASTSLSEGPVSDTPQSVSEGTIHDSGGSLASGDVVPTLPHVVRRSGKAPSLSSLDEGTISSSKEDELLHLRPRQVNFQEDDDTRSKLRHTVSSVAAPIMLSIFQ